MRWRSCCNTCGASSHMAMVGAEWVLEYSLFGCYRDWKSGYYPLESCKLVYSETYFPNMFETFFAEFQKTFQNSENMLILAPIFIFNIREKKMFCGILRKSWTSDEVCKVMFLCLKFCKIAFCVANKIQNVFKYDNILEWHGLCTKDTHADLKAYTENWCLSCNKSALTQPKTSLGNILTHRPFQGSRCLEVNGSGLIRKVRALILKAKS